MSVATRTFPQMSVNELSETCAVYFKQKVSEEIQDHIRQHKPPTYAKLMKRVGGITHTQHQHRQQSTS